MRKVNVCLYLLLVSFIFHLFGCGSTREVEGVGNVELIEIDFDKPNVEEKVSLREEVLKNIQFIPLETTPNSFIAYISRVESFMDHFYVLDDTHDNLFIFDNTGKFIGKIGTPGNGPGEYVDLADFCIDPVEKEVIILSVGKRQMIRYDLMGKYIDAVRLPFQSWRTNYVGNGKFAHNVCFFDPVKTNLKLTDARGNLLFSGFEFPADVQPMSLVNVSGQMTETKDGILYSDPSSSLVYQITSDQNIYPKYKINFKGKVWPEERRFEFQQFFDELNTKGDLNYLTNDYEENDNAFIFKYNHAQSGEYTKLVNWVNAYYIKSTGKLFFAENLRKDLFTKLLSPPIGVTESGKFVSTISPSAYYSSVANFEPDENLNQVFQNVKMEGNPVLCIYDVYE